MLKKVVFPAPFGPIRLTIERSGIVKSTSLTATRPPNSLRTPSASRRLATLLVRRVVERLVVDTLVELRPAPRARNQALRPEEHRQHEDQSEDPGRIQRHVDVLAEDGVADTVRVHPRADVREPLLVQVREERSAQDHAPDVAHPAEDDHAKDKDRDVEIEVSGERAALEAGVERAGDAAEECARGVRPRLSPHQRDAHRARGGLSLADRDPGATEA